MRKLLWLVLCVVLSVNQPIYWVKVLGIDGSTIAAPLDIASIEFTDTVFVPGQHRPGEFTMYLHNTRKTPSYRTTYNLLKREQRIEVYENPDLLGDPEFTGVLVRQVRDLAGNRQWTGYRSEYRLTERRLRNYHLLNGDVNDVSEWLLSTYTPVVTDNFDDLTNWTSIGVPPPTVANNILTLVEDAGGNVGAVTYNVSYAMARTNTSFDFKLTPIDTTAQEFELKFNALGGNYFRFSVWYDSDDVSDNAILIGLYDCDGVNPENIIAERNIVLDLADWHHLDFHTEIVGATREFVVSINGIEMLAGSGAEVLGENLSTSINAYYFIARTDFMQVARFMIASATAALTPGNIDASADTVDQVFNGDPQLDALEWICEQQDWEYRIRPKAGAGNDLIDIGAAVGNDHSAAIILKDSENIVSLDVDEISDGFATQLHVYGQSRDDATSGFVSSDLDAIDTYGIVEDEYSDDKVVDSATAKVVGDARLTRLSAGTKSISGRILDESYLLGQDPKWGFAIWGDFIWGGRKHLRAGDWVKLESDDLGLNESHEIISLTRRSGDPAIDVVFDAHGWRASDENRETNRRLKQLNRAFNKKTDTQTLVFELTDTDPLTLSFNMRGNLYKNVYLDVTSASWAGAVTLAIDTVDRTNALFGAATIAADAFGNDTTYLIYSGAHEITLTPTVTVTVTVGIRPVLQG